jgi:cytochrome c-type biogenesis protein CcmE
VKPKFIIAGLVIAAAIAYLIYTATNANSQYFLTVRELLDRKSEMLGRDVRVSGAVLGETIQYDPASLELGFTIAHVPGSQKEIDAQGGLAMALHLAAADPALPRLKVTYNGPRPDLLQNEAQAILTGQMQPDGSFRAGELLLKCPSRYEESLPGQAK